MIPTGSIEVATHAYYTNIDWAALESKNIPPPPLQGGDIPVPKYAFHRSLRQLLIETGRDNFLQPPADVQAMDDAHDEGIIGPFESWEYTSPAAVMLEISALATGSSF